MGQKDTVVYLRPIEELAAETLEQSNISRRSDLIGHGVERVGPTRKEKRYFDFREPGCREGEFTRLYADSNV